MSLRAILAAEGLHVASFYPSWNQDSRQPGEYNIETALGSYFYSEAKGEVSFIPAPTNRVTPPESARARSYSAATAWARTHFQQYSEAAHVGTGDLARILSDLQQALRTILASRVELVQYSPNSGAVWGKARGDRDHDSKMMRVFHHLVRNTAVKLQSPLPPYPAEGTSGTYRVTGTIEGYPLVISIPYDARVFYTFTLTVNP